MSLASINRVLAQIQDDPAWLETQCFLTVLQAWDGVVGEIVAQQTCPITIHKPAKLIVAVASGAWAQTLSFERHRILTKLNQHLKIPLKDIHFSQRDWPPPKYQRRTSESHHPHLTPSTSPPSATGVEIKTAQAAFAQWSAQVQRHTHRLPLCPCCQCPTPRPELDQWRMCRLCAARQPQNLPTDERYP